MLLFASESDSIEALRAYAGAVVNGGNFCGFQVPPFNQVVQGPWRYYRLERGLILTVEINKKPMSFNEDDRLKIQEMLYFDMSTKALMTKLEELEVLYLPGLSWDAPRNDLRDALPQLRQLALKPEQFIIAACPAAR